MNASVTPKALWILVFSALLASSVRVLADEEAAESPFVLNWKTLHEQNQLAVGEIVAQDGPHANVLKVVSPQAALMPVTPAVVTLCEIPAPRIQDPVYMLSGWVRHEDVQGKAFFDMWTIFPDGSRYFTRTLADVGPLRFLQGTSAWRQVQIPFQMEDGPDAARPSAILLNIVFEGPGTVWLTNLELTEHKTLFAAMQSEGWWSDRTAGRIGAVGGCVIALVAILVWILASRGRARGFVNATLLTASALGFAAVIVGVVAAASGQPYGVYYPLLLMGGITATLSLIAFFRLRKQYAAAELRRMESLDAHAVASH